MKKFLIMFMMILGAISINSTLIVSAEEESNKEFVSKYETWNLDLSEEELIQYYIDNDIRPASAPSGSEGKLFYGDVSNHLKTRFPAYSSWSVSTNTSYVGDIYGGNPLETDDPNSFNLNPNPHIAEAKRLAGITYNALGCGPLAMISQFDYLARYAGYVSIANKLEDFTDPTVTKAPNFVVLAREILENTDTIPADGPLGNFFGVNPSNGTFTFPHEVINSSREILENHYLSIKKTEEVVDEEGNVSTRTYYDNDSQILVSGDTIPSLSSFSTKINNLKDSIDRGMPVIWWTLGEDKAKGFGNHYMNIFGYEYWSGTDSAGNTKTHLMFVLRYNWGEADVYMDSDLLDAVNGGFIYFEETHEKTLVKPENYGYECQYFYDEKPKTINPELGYTFDTKYLRTGYVNRYDSTNTNFVDQQISLSAKRTNAGQAYIHYELPIPVTWMYLEVNWWSSSEGIAFYNGQAKVEYKDHYGNWVTQLDLLNDVSGNISNLIDYKSKIKCEFEYPVTEFRIYVKSDNPSGDRNKGRLVLGNILLIHEEFEHTYSYTSNGSSGHTATCSCGEISTQPHAVNSSQATGRYANCIQCGHLVDLGTDIVIGVMSVEEMIHSENGSYILSDGTIVLVEEDIEAYLNGTLILSSSGEMF